MKKRYIIIGAMAALIFAWGFATPAGAIPEFDTECGDGTLDTTKPKPNEQCEDYNGNNNDDCTDKCKVATCGDGYVHTESTNMTPVDLPTPQFAKTPGPIEGCDDGNNDWGDGCSPLCFVELNCRNGTLDPGEPCDPTDPATAADCTEICTSAITCGDGEVDEDNGEECDDGNKADDDDCDSRCLLPRCGDLRTNGTEECDDSNTNNYDSCGNDCMHNVCGDGTIDVDNGEVCDDGTDDGTDCDTGCAGPAPAACDDTGPAGCGDGDMTGGLEPYQEQCDDGNCVDGDGCDNSCHIEYCGDGIVNTDNDLGTDDDDDGVDECDDGNLIPYDGCLTCSTDLPVYVWPTYFSWTDSNTNIECDQIIIPFADRWVSSDNCVVRDTCGDGFVISGEECDDGNTDDGDGCSATCTIETSGYCGDGVVDEFEQCDDGNDVNDDICSNNCTFHPDSSCGDGVPEAPEQCDDGNNDDGDGCSNSCQRECDATGDCIDLPAEDMTDVFADADGGGGVAGVCGDGTVDAGEECDDGGNVDGDGCSSVCTLECGDGDIDGTEECDDGNTDDGDCCASDCTLDAAGTTCGTAGECQTDPTCDGAGTCSGTPVADGTACGDDSSDECTDADSCQSGVCDSNDAPAGTECTENPSADFKGVCDNAGVCVDSTEEAGGDGCTFVPVAAGSATGASILLIGLGVLAALRRRSS